jgi:bifunctional non-homologous end joining protein LigD
MPAKVAPMLCTLTKEPIDDENYLHEIKWDGYRIISYVDGNKVRMDSRSAKDYTHRYPPIVKALKALKHKVILDGEVVVFNKQGLPDFDALQLYNGHSTPVAYCLFDILWLDGYNLMELPLVKRKGILQQLLGNNEVLRFSESFDDGPALYKRAIGMNLEGIVSKEKNSTYEEDERGNKWLKTPTRVRQEFVIGGWAESDRGRSFRSLLFGAYNKKGELEWIGRSGGGYKEKEMPGILKKLKSLEVKTSPFANKILDTKGATIHYVKPQLVANFEFATWTKSGRIRKPATFLGFRSDKKAKEVVREVPKSVETIEEEVQEKEEPPREKEKPFTAKDSNWRVIERTRHETVGSFEVGDCNIELYDVDRPVWKNIPKAKLIEYYHSIAKYILPHLKDRPLSLHIKPGLATAPGFYIKDMEGRQPDCADIFSDKRRHPKAGKRSRIDYLVCNNEATLLYCINLGCIDMNPWMSRTNDIEHPDYINIDLDPSDDDFRKAIEAALAAKEVMAQWKLRSFVKTSGKTGIHIFIPVRGIGFQQARDISEKLGEQVHQLLPDLTTTNVNISSRGNKLFIDPSQNDYADTLASVYSARPSKLPTVSTPLDWKEVNSRLDPEAFTIDTILNRIRRKGELFADALDEKIGLKNASVLKKME